MQALEFHVPATNLQPHFILKQVKVPACTGDWRTKKKKYTLEFWRCIFSLTFDSSRVLYSLVQKQKVLSLLCFTLKHSNSLRRRGEKTYFSKPHFHKSNMNCIGQQLNIARVSEKMCVNYSIKWHFVLVFYANFCNANCS